MRNWTDLAKQAQVGHGRVTAHEACDTASGSAVSRAVQSGRLVRPQPRVLAVTGAPANDTTRLLDIVLSIGEHAAITSWAALWVLGLVRHAPSKVEVAVSRAHKPRPRTGAIIHRPAWLRDGDIRTDTVPAITSFAVTLIFLARTANKRYLRSLMIHARQRGLLDLHVLAEVLARAGNAPGTKVLRELCFELAGTNADSMLELYFRERWAATPWPQPLAGTLKIDTPRHPVTLDVPWPEYLVAVECHGMGKYNDKWSLDSDTRRENHVKATDWQVLEATWGRVDGPQWPQLVDEIVDVLDLQARRWGLPPVRPS